MEQSSTTNVMPDTALVQAAKNGDTKAFSQLICKYQKKVKVLGMSFFRNSTDAEDFVQDVFIKIYTSLNTFRGESLFSTWLMRIAYNTAINSVKRRKEYAPLSDDYELTDNDFGPEEKQLRALTIESVRETLKEIPENYAACLDMYFFYDMAYTEIGIVLDLPVNTVKSHIFRAKKLVKQKLEEIL